MGDSTPLGIAVEDPVAYLLAGRFALIVALVGEDRRPYATRGWGLTVLPGRPAQSASFSAVTSVLRSKRDRAAVRSR